jgi:hypothetical protein
VKGKPLTSNPLTETGERRVLGQVSYIKTIQAGGLLTPLGMSEGTMDTFGSGNIPSLRGSAGAVAIPLFQKGHQVVAWARRFGGLRNWFRESPRIGARYVVPAVLTRICKSDAQVNASLIASS